MSAQQTNQGRLRFRILKRTRFLQRFYGLLGRRRPQADKLGLLFRPCRAVHTWGMRFPLDIVFLDCDGQVLKVVERLASWRVALCPKTVAVVELHAGTIAAEHGNVARIEAAAKNAIGR
jgi:uncharacterized protein